MSKIHYIGIGTWYIILFFFHQMVVFFHIMFHITFFDIRNSIYSLLYLDGQRRIENKIRAEDIFFSCFSELVKNSEKILK